MKNSNRNVKKKNRSSSRKRNHSVTKQLSRIMDDENTTNSETSEHGVFSDINWEENLEVDTTSLLEEFAPQALPKPSVKQTEKLSDSSNKNDSNDKQEKLSAAVEFELCDIESPADFHIGLNLLILHYKTNQWVEGVIEEIDQEEEEVLVRYENRSDNPEEWLSMKSQRIKKKVSLASSNNNEESLEVQNFIGSLKKEVIAESPSRESSGSSVSVTEPTAYTDQPSPPTPQTSTSSVPPKPKKKKISMKKIKKSIKKPVFKKTVAISSKTSQRRPIQLQDRKTSRRMPVWKSNHQHSSKASNSVVLVADFITSSKFSEGEKVLAKWSDHRMQKFPAIIKGISGDRLYDVLFYDGFEKTIMEDNIYKSTEEEMAKYKESKPSEADSFIEIDSSSKHERRQKKRKTFDGFFEEKDFKRPKKLESYDLNRSESFQRASVSRNKPTIQSFSVHAKRFGPSSPKSMPSSPNPPKSVSASSKPSPSSVKPAASPKIPPVPRNNLTSEVKAEDKLPEKSPVQDSTEKEEDSPQKSPLTPEPTKVAVVQSISKRENKSDEISDLADPITSYKYPLEITCQDGRIRKSVLIEDDKLPYGWTKHVINWVENVWACFLFSPDKYAVHSVIELRKYFRVSDGQEPPEGLDFSFPKDALQDLIEKQKKLGAKADYRKWVNKILDERKVMKKVRILPPSRSIGPGGHLTTKRVRTLLPRYRTHVQNSGKSSEGKVWRCPKSDCTKKFRKENLLQMHIKHYHRDLSELAGCAPNVVDLALARTSADGAFTSDLIKRSVPKSPLYDYLTEKNNENSSSLTDKPSESKVGQSSTGMPLQLNNTNPNLTSTPVLPVSSIKVLTPSKQSKPKIENEGNPHEIIETKERVRLHNTPKSVIKKPSDPKSADDMAYLSGSRALKKKQQPIEKPSSVETFPSEVILDEELKEDGTAFDRLQSEEIINCICGFKEEDGLMVQCEICLCWQHGACHRMENDSDVPERYVCTICLDPLHVRSSQRYSYANHYLTLTKLPRFNYRTCKEDVLRHREKILSKSFELTSNLQSIHRMERTLAAKINIAQQSDHPKLYLWSTNWDCSKKKHIAPGIKKAVLDSNDKGRRGPVGEAPIESIDCRLRLLDKIEADQQDMESRLTIIQAQLQALESEDFDVGGEDNEGHGGDPLLKQAIYMLLRDLSTIATATSLS